MILPRGANGVIKGYALIDFEDKAACLRGIAQLDNTAFKGQQIRVSMAKPSVSARAGAAGRQGATAACELLLVERHVG
jgi:RNA recognition motif-containing protein